MILLSLVIRVLPTFAVTHDRTRLDTVRLEYTTIHGNTALIPYSSENLSRACVGGAAVRIRNQDTPLHSKSDQIRPQIFTFFSRGTLFAHHLH